LKFTPLCHFHAAGGKVTRRAPGVFEKLKELGHLSHMRCLGTTAVGNVALALDARVQGNIFTEEYYATNHMMGG
jgi:hypothetical protein